MSLTPNIPTERRDVVMAEAAKFLVARLQSSEDAITVARSKSRVTAIMCPKRARRRSEASRG